LFYFLHTLESFLVTLPSFPVPEIDANSATEHLLLLWQYFTKGDKNFQKSEKSTGAATASLRHPLFFVITTSGATASLTIDTSLHLRFQ
jgi:hypothetical protein